MQVISHQNDNIIADQIARVITGSKYNLRFLGQGATSAAYWMSIEDENMIIRFMPPGTNRPVTYQSEFNILRILREKDCHVPEPILTSPDIPETDIPVEWALTKAVPGNAIKKGNMTFGLAQDLGRFLSVLHSIPVTGFGRLIEKKGVIEGQSGDQLTGLKSRWCWAPLWPFDNTDINQHPIGTISPELTNVLKTKESDILSVCLNDAAVLVHSDLHGEHIFEKDGRLSGIIDFGASYIGSRAWDFASIAFYFGWDMMMTALESYDPEEERESLIINTRFAALVLSLYKLYRAFDSQAPPQKINRITQFIELTLIMNS